MDYITLDILLKTETLLLLVYNYVKHMKYLESITLENLNIDIFTHISATDSRNSLKITSNLYVLNCGLNMLTDFILAEQFL